MAGFVSRMLRVVILFPSLKIYHVTLLVSKAIHYHIVLKTTSKSPFLHFSNFLSLPRNSYSLHISVHTISWLPVSVHKTHSPFLFFSSSASFQPSLAPQGTISPHLSPTSNYLFTLAFGITLLFSSYVLHRVLHHPLVHYVFIPTLRPSLYPSIIVSHFITLFILQDHS